MPGTDGPEGTGGGVEQHEAAAGELPRVESDQQPVGGAHDLLRFVADEREGPYGTAQLAHGRGRRDTVPLDVPDDQDESGGGLDDVVPVTPTSTSWVPER